MDEDASPNQQLAERIGALRAEDRSLEALRALDDDLADVLLRYRRALDADSPVPSAAQSRRLWQRIESAMDAEAESEAPTQRRDRRPERRSQRRWARVGVGGLAVVLLAIGAWLLWPASGPQLVAQSGATLTTHRTDRGDVIRLRPHSRLYRQTDAEARYRIEGEAMFEVSPRTEAPFVVAANGAVVRVLGTRFVVQAWTPRPTVYVDEGRVELRADPDDAPVVLTAGERGTLSAEGRLQVQPGQARTYLDWLEGQIAFDAEAAATVAAELEQHYDLEIVLPDAVARQTLSGELVLDGPDRTLSAFGRVLGGDFQRRDGAYRFQADE
jgi:ferric-dicitrate binding protein FerR (iron transport regulator)